MSGSSFTKETCQAEGEVQQSEESSVEPEFNGLEDESEDAMTDEEEGVEGEGEAGTVDWRVRAGP